MLIYIYSLRDDKVKIQNFAEEIMPEQFDGGWQQKLQMRMQMVKILTEELRPFIPKVNGKHVFVFWLLLDLFQLQFLPYFLTFLMVVLVPEEDLTQE